MSVKSEYLGIDTSNYTTSVALYSSDGMESCRRLLPVREGERGLRQSDAVFLHVKQFPDIFDTLPKAQSLTAVGVSSKPRNTDDSYMPCFRSGVSYARVLARSHGCPLYEFSHQQGHIAAGVWSSGREDLLSSPFLAFHVSGGTTELLLVNGIRDIQIVAHTLDLHAGQLIDRIGVLLGYSFPCGAAMDPDALRGEKPTKHRVRLKDGCCSLSGYENKAQKMIADGCSKEDVAFFAVDSVSAELEGMIDAALLRHPNLPLLMIGGVCSNSILRRRLTQRYGAIFAGNGFSCDNAAGIAYLTKLCHEGVIR
ncbi:MAG: peptidase M22 [Clostridia bacterium]|nr:peptidase M22 [Clostridia bacterium]